MFVMILLRTGPQRLLAIALSWRGLGLLTAFTAWAVLSAAILPGIFKGAIFVYPMRTGTSAFVPVPLDYATSNLTQACYLVLSYLTALSVAVSAAKRDFDQTFRRMFLWLGWLIILTGILDILGFNSFLSFFRNASYALVGDTSVGSARRVVGAMPEASAFGGTAATVFTVLLLFRHRFGLSVPWLLCTAGTGALAALSTSSAAYAMLLGTALAFSIQAAIRFVFGGSRDHAAAINDLCGAAILALLLLVGLFLADDIAQIAGRVLDEMVFRKALSASFEERTRWSRVALDSFFESSGLGIGVGSARTSNGFVNLIASTGVIGSALFGAFLARTFLASSPLSRGVGIGDAWAARLALISPFIGFLLAGTTSDYGAFAAILFGIQLGGHKAFIERAKKAEGNHDHAPHRPPTPVDHRENYTS